MPSAVGHPGQWAAPCTRAAVWSFLINSTQCELRERVWCMWTNRGDSAGDFDNKPLLVQMLNLRGWKARLLGFPSFAHRVTADRMAGTPGVALNLLQRTWQDVLPMTRIQIAAPQAIAYQRALVAPCGCLSLCRQIPPITFGVQQFVGIGLRAARHGRHRFGYLTSSNITP
ncbi:MAG: M3 family metallopeptidase [Betaproteobacteria bacterium]